MRFLSSFSHLVSEFGCYVFKDLNEKYSIVDESDEVYRHYELQDELGKGAFSVVRQGRHRNTGPSLKQGKFVNLIRRACGSENYE